MKKLVKDIRKGEVLIWEGVPRKILSRVHVSKFAGEIAPHMEFELEGLEGVLITSREGYLEVQSAPPVE